MLARLAFFLLLIVPPMALAADAPPGAGKITIIKQPPKVAAAAPAPAPAPALTPAAVSPAPRVDASECRASCAETNYLCRASDQPDDCGGHWSQCVAACNTPNLAPAFSTPP